MVWLPFVLEFLDQDGSSKQLRLLKLVHALGHRPQSLALQNSDIYFLKYNVQLALKFKGSPPVWNDQPFGLRDQKAQGQYTKVFHL